jgi:hypothetical protein
MEMGQEEKLCWKLCWKLRWRLRLLYIGEVSAQHSCNRKRRVLYSRRPAPIGMEICSIRVPQSSQACKFNTPDYAMRAQMVSRVGLVPVEQLT